MLKKTTSAVLGVLLAGTLTLPECQAQTRKKAPSSRQSLSRNFSRGPKVGAQLPDLSAFDANGKPFKLSQLKGSHSVIVFGCLT
ncbi:MAG: hypothetical protein Tsb009_16550 [Planctomycetaceae bacterium]